RRLTGRFLLTRSGFLISGSTGAAFRTVFHWRYAEYSYVLCRLCLFAAILSSYLLSNTLSLALLEREFCSSSSFEGKIGLRVTTVPLLFLPHTQTGKSGGQIHGFSFSRNWFFTIRSSRE